MIARTAAVSHDANHTSRPPARAALRLAACAGIAMSTTAAHAIDFTFTPQCANTNWFGECTGAPCIPSGINTFNNWGQTACAAGLPLPGAADTAVLDGATVTQNGSVNILNFTTNASTNWTWSTGNLTVGQPSTSSGTMSVTGALNRALSGAVSNNGSWTDNTGGFTTTMSTAAFTNNAAHTLAGQQYFRNGSTTNSYTNNGTLNKTTAIGSIFTSIAFTQNGTLNVQDGTLTITGTFPKTFGAASSTNTSPGASLILSGSGIAGNLSGTNAGSIILSSPDLGSNLTLNVSGNPIDWSAGNLRLFGSTLEVSAATDLIVSGAADRNISDGGTVINNGSWTDATGGFNTALSTANITNNGTWILQGQSYSRFGSSSNSITNNGTLNKTSAAASTISIIPFNQNGTLNVQEGTLTLTGSFPNTFGSSSTTNTSPTATLAFSGTPASGTLVGANNGSITLTSLSLSGDFTMNPSGNAILWPSGNLAMGGFTFTIGPDASLRQVSALSRGMSGGAIINNGSWTDDTGGGFGTSLSTVAITNNGTWNSLGHSYGRFGSSTNSITNNGTLRKTGAAASILTSIPFTNNGLIEVEEGVFSRAGSFTYTQNPGGILRVYAGAFAEPGGASWQGGRLEGLGTINASNSYILFGPTVISPGVPGDEGGTLTLSGGTQLVMDSGDTLEVELDARPSVPGGADRLFCNHTVTLGGATLDVSLAPGFLPTLGDQYEVLRTTIGAGTPIGGTFTPVFDVPPGVTFSIQYFSQFVLLTVTGTLCDSTDFNGDGLFPDTADIDDFLSVFSGGPCSTGTCGDIDFNNDGLFPDTLDIDSLLSVFSGGACL
ncbi:MAG TPA: hypothetical protein VHN77_12750 [Phycisphaerales bacterium]|nr:hypothetical protein [Phycisphaerales bacterium]